MKTIGIGCTDIGRLRDNNEDDLLVDNQIGLYVVSDGMGGHAAGEIASAEAVAAVAGHIYRLRHAIAQIRAGEMAEEGLEDIVTGAVAAACRAVFRRAISEPSLSGMGCTLTVLLTGRSKAAMAHVGDSRLYLLRHGEVRQLSTDHNVAQLLMERGIAPADAGAFAYCRSALTRAIGRDELTEIEHGMVDLWPGDQLVLCSDGLSDYLSSPETLRELLASDVFTASVQRLIEFANYCGGEDNVTAIVVRVDEGKHDTDDDDPPPICFRRASGNDTLSLGEATTLH